MLKGNYHSVAQKIYISKLHIEDHFMNKFFGKYFLLMTLLSSLFYSCENPTSPDPIYYQISNTPIITGIVRTGSDSPEPLGIIGSPNEKSELSVNVAVNTSNMGSSIPKNFNMSPLYPNPTDGSISIRYSLPYKSDVSVWVVRGKSPEESSNTNNTVYTNGYFITPSNNFIQELSSRTAYAGSYAIIWDIRDQKGNILPDGYYRIYLVVNGNLMWRDLWIYKHAGEEGYY
jgi:hypothetical protein